MSAVLEQKAAELVRWVSFDDDWRAYWRKHTKTQFIYKHVNGRCAYVAHLFRLWMKSGKEQYGHFWGVITNPDWAERPIIRHGWLKHEIIVDPTRWCFLEEKLDCPQLALCPADSPDYDLGGNRIRAKNRNTMPAFDPARRVKCKNQRILKLFAGEVCNGRLSWLANLAPTDPVFTAEKDRANMYLWLQNNGFGAWIPLDNQIESKN